MKFNQSSETDPEMMQMLELTDKGTKTIMIAVVSTYPCFHIPWFQLPVVDCGTKRVNGKFQK